LLPNPPPMSGDHLDLVLGEAGDHRVHRAVRVRRLGVRPEHQLAGDRIHVGHGPAGLHRRRVRPGVEHLLLDDHATVGEGRGERLVGLGRVARFPVVDVVVGLAVLVVADDLGVGVEGLLRVDDHRQRLVLDVDQVERVTRRVAILGDDERDLLAVEAHLVGGEHRLGVVRQRGHPGEAERLERRAGDDGVHLRVRLGLGGVDRHDPRVRVRAAQDRAVEHAGQLDVVDVVAVAADEAHVLLAEHAPEPDRVAGCAGGNRSVGHAHALTSLLFSLSAA
jgi:hypothetical protein